MQLRSARFSTIGVFQPLGSDPIGVLREIVSPVSGPQVEVAQGVLQNPCGKIL
jgi:hypothetical protein